VSTRLVVGVALVRDGRVLAARRADTDDWEFPGGKVEPGESPEDAAVREIAEELGCTVAVTGWLAPTVPIATGLELRVATARLVAGDPLPSAGDHTAIRWLRPHQLGEVTWAEADRPFVAELTGGSVGGAD
jgi:8-oxo-dGTP diphosphatase